MLARTARARLTQFTCPACRFLSTASVAPYSTQLHATPSSSSESSSTARSIIFSSPIYNPASNSNARYQRQHPLKYHRRRNVPSDEEGQSGQAQRRSKRMVSDPNERLTNAPKRMCIVTRQILPSSFLINLRPTYFPSSSESPEILKLLPDRILTKGRSKKGKGIWVSCNRDMIDRLMSGKGPHTGIVNQIQGLTIPPNLDLIVHVQLLDRIIIELSSLAQRLQSSSSSGQVDGGDITMDNRPILRRLTNLEVSQLKLDSPGSTYHPNINTSPVEGGWEIPWQEVIQQDDKVDEGKGEIIALLDISGLSPTTTKPIQDESSTSNTSSSNLDKIDIPLISLNQSTVKQIPLYDLSKLFTFPTFHQHQQRVEMLLNLKKILSIERKYKRRRYTNSTSTSTSTLTPRLESIRDHSDLLALYNYPSFAHNDHNLLGIPLFIALWRLRCFFGNGWESVRV